MRGDNVNHGPQEGLRRALAVFLALCIMSFFVFSLAEDVLATIKPPVHVRLGTDWVPKNGGPPIHVATKDEVINIHIEISSGVDMDGADFDLILPEGWEFVGGDKKWQGKLIKGQKIKLKTKVRTTSDKFGIIKGELNLPSADTSVWGILDLRDPETTDRVPEAGVGRKVPDDVPIIFMEDIAPWLKQEPEPKRLLPEHSSRIDLQTDQKQSGSKIVDSPGCEVRAYGRLAYTDDQGIWWPISHAEVILKDDDGDVDDDCGSTFTDWDGYFTVDGSCGDPDGGRPDIFLLVHTLNPDYGWVEGNHIIYTWYTDPIYEDFCGEMNFGTRTPPPGQNGAWQLFNQLVQAWKYIMQVVGTTPPPVGVNWPAGGTGNWYSGEIYINDTWSEPAMYHEYGHHLMNFYGRVGYYDYCNGICDRDPPVDCGHCGWSPEKGWIAYMEGWPDFFSAVQTEVWVRDDRYDWETHHDDLLYPNVGEIEGFVAAILWDIYDNASDNQHNDESYDDLSLGFSKVWHTNTYFHPWNLHDFWDGFSYFYNEDLPGLCSVYAEHHVIMDFEPPSNPTSIVSTSHLPGIWSNNNTIKITWSGASDDLCGVGGYGHIWSYDPYTIPGEALDTTATELTRGPLADVDGLYFHIRTVDRAGNWQANALHLGPYRIDTTPPAGTISIDDGKDYVTSMQVSLTLPCTDASSGCDQMRFSNGTFWSSWEAYGTNKSWQLSLGSGTKTVYVQYKDHAGNISSSFHDDIILVMHDLAETRVTNAPASVALGGSIWVSDTVENKGNLPCGGDGGTITRYYLSLTPAKTVSSKRLDGDRPTPYLYPAETSRGERTVVVPFDTAPGTYYFLACADDKDKLTESDEYNNCLASSTMVQVGLELGPDYIETSVSLPPERTIAPRGRYVVGDTVRNQGLLDSAMYSITRYYLSENQVRGGADKFLGGRLVPPLARFESNSGSASVTVPATTTPGPYYVLACADQEGSVDEINENNNCIASSTTVQVSLPDYIETYVSDPPEAIVPGRSLGLQHTVVNQGSAGFTETTTTSHYLSLDKTKDSGDTPLSGITKLVPPLGAEGGTFTGTASLTVPAKTTLGLYYVLACADATNAVVESDEANNCIASSGRVQVTRPDYVEGYVSDPPTTARLGTPFQVVDTVSNEAAVGSDTVSITWYYLTTDPVLKGGGKWLLKGTRSVDPLGPGANHTGQANVFIPTTVPLGSYHVMACADGKNVITETVERNNCRMSIEKVQITK